MRYPIWLFMFVFVIPPSQIHAVLTGGARVEAADQRVSVTRIAPSGDLQVKAIRAQIG